MNKEIDWEKVDSDVAAVIFNEAQLEKEQTIKSLESTRQKSTVLLSVTLGLFTFVASRINSLEALFQNSLTVLLLGLFIGFCCFIAGLWPRKFKSMGSLPSRLLFPDVAEHGLKHLYSCMIVSVEQGIRQNHKAARSAARCFLSGFVVLFVTLFIFLVVFLEEVFLG